MEAHHKMSACSERCLRIKDNHNRKQAKKKRMQVHITWICSRGILGAWANAKPKKESKRKHQLKQIMKDIPFLLFHLAKGGDRQTTHMDMPNITWIFSLSEPLLHRKGKKGTDTTGIDGWIRGSGEGSWKVQCLGLWVGEDIMASCPTTSVQESASHVH